MSARFSRFFCILFIWLGSLNSFAATHPFAFRLSGEPETLDWNRAHTPIETFLLMNLMEGLLTFDSQFKLVPSLASTWTISQDQRTYVFKLRDGVKWSDGVALRAQDFVYSWKRLLSPITAASYAYLLFDIVGAEDFYHGKLPSFDSVGVKALDDHTLEVKLAHPVAHWIFIPSFWVTFPLRQDLVEKYGNGWVAPGRMVTVGPYVLESHDIDSKISLTPNPNYSGPRGNIDQIVGLIVKDDATALSLYEAGKLDFLTDISTIDLKRLQGRGDLKTFPYLKTGYLGFVVNKFPTSNLKLRRAIAMAIDKTKLSDILHGEEHPATSFVPPGLLGYDKKMGLPFDPITARSELRASGIDLSKPLNLELLLPNWDKQLILAQYIQGELKKNLSIEMSIQSFDHKTYRSSLDLHAYPLFEGSWSADFPDPDNFMSIFLGDSGNNRFTWKDAHFDDLVLTARSLPNPKNRLENYLEAEKMLLERDAVIVPLYYEPNLALVKQRVKGIELNPLNYLFLKKVNVEP